MEHGKDTNSVGCNAIKSTIQSIFSRITDFFRLGMSCDSGGSPVRTWRLASLIPRMVLSIYSKKISKLWPQFSSSYICNSHNKKETRSPPSFPSATQGPQERMEHLRPQTKSCFLWPLFKNFHICPLRELDFHPVLRNSAHILEMICSPNLIFFKKMQL